MHTIKKYANRKLYDTNTKRSINMNDIAEMIQSGEKFVVIDNQTGDDITPSIISQLISRNLSDQGSEIPMAFMTDLLRKGSGGLLGSVRKYVGLWQSAVTMAESGIDKAERLIDKDEDAPGIDQGPIDSDINRQHEEFMTWLEGRIEENIERYLSKNNFASEKQIFELRSTIKEMSAKIDAVQSAYQDLLERTPKRRKKRVLIKKKNAL